MPWVPRGLREGIVTSRYPHRPDGYGEGFYGSVHVTTPSSPEHGAASVGACPTDAIATDAHGPHLDRGRCILCGRCVAASPEVFRLDANVETADVRRHALIVPHRDESDDEVERARAALAKRVAALRRSVHIRHVDAGSDGSEEWEVAALTNPVYDVQRLGIYFTASPRHADLLLVTGVGSAGMLEPLRATYDAMPDPRVVIAAGADAVSGGLVGEGYASAGGVSELVPVDVFVPGSPPSPFGLLFAIMLGIGLLRGRDVRHSSPPSGSIPRAERGAS